MTTPPKTLTTLEYDKVIARLARHCGTEPGRALAAALLPPSESREVLPRQRLTAEARRLRELKPNVSLDGVHDVRTLAHQAGLGHALEPGELREVQSPLSVAHTLGETVERLRTYLPFLAEITDRIADFRDISGAIGRAIDAQGEVVDSASPVLAQLRRESRVAHDRLSTRLQQMLKSNRGAVQEPLVTLRDGRYVIPVKAEMRSQLPGIVHDVSSSGATVFLEPLETVEMGNHWRELLAEEQREIARILRELSAAVGRRADEIAAAVDALAEVDLLLAKTRLGDAMVAKALPHDDEEQRWLSEEPGSLCLLNARHPLLTGDASRLPVFDSVFADIGDEQSIEQSLSTFSSHVGNIISILNAATGRSLVLLDELAAGTDPMEGAALAKAILR